MTPRQKQIFDFIDLFRAAHGYSPTLDEIAAAHCISKNTTFGHVHELIRQGRLMHTPHVTRSLRPTDDKAVEASKIICGVADLLGGNVGDLLGRRLHFQAELRRAAGMILSA